eukprot:5198911-Pleurochrysis_carterae.AAC.2
MLPQLQHLALSARHGGTGLSADYRSGGGDGGADAKAVRLCSALAYAQCETVWRELLVVLDGEVRNSKCLRTLHGWRSHALGDGQGICSRARSLVEGTQGRDAAKAAHEHVCPLRPRRCAFRRLFALYVHALLLSSFDLAILFALHHSIRRLPPPPAHPPARTTHHRPPPAHLSPMS